MRPPRPPRDPQRGNSLLLALIVMSALATLGSLTVVSMQSSIQMSTNDRAQAIALYAAESGAAVTMVALRRIFNPAPPNPGWTAWSAYLTEHNNPPFPDITPLVPSSGARPGDPTNLFDRDQNAWYEIQLLNNPDDPSFGAGTSTNDTDGIVIIRSTGHGPQGSTAIIEWTVQRVGFWAAIGTTALAPQGPSLPPPTTPPPYPGFLLYPPATADPSHPLPYPPSLTGGWDSWVPKSLDIHGVGPPSFYNVGMVLLGWHIVSL